MKLRLQLVAGSVAVQLDAPLVRVTVPVGVPAPGALTLSAKVKRSAG
jgi:hypothetical protein